LAIMKWRDVIVRRGCNPGAPQPGLERTNRTPSRACAAGRHQPPPPAWSVFERGIRAVTLSVSKRRCATSMTDQLGAPEGPGEAHEKQRPVAQPGQIVRIDGDQPLDVGRDQRGCRPHRPWMLPADAGQRLPDGRVPGLPRVAEAAMMPGDRRDPAARRAAAQRWRRQPGRDHHRVHRQQRRIDSLLPRPLRKNGPVALAGRDRSRRDRFAGLIGGLRQPHRPMARRRASAGRARWRRRAPGARPMPTPYWHRHGRPAKGSRRVPVRPTRRRRGDQPRPDSFPAARWRPILAVWTM
jgi:hypothetical protein